jgi:anti-sigma factor RsiW
MEHQEATRTQASSRYLLGELSATEREAFEEHYFSCPLCAEEVRLGASLADNAKAVFSEPSFRRETEWRARPRWMAWLRPATLVPTAAAAALLILYGYQAGEL